MAKKILLVEDDSSLGYLLSEYLKLKGFEVEWRKNGHDGLLELQSTDFDLCIFDVMLPAMDGFELASKTRKAFPNLPFIFLTAKSLKIDTLKGLSLGAEDYIKKPVDEEELVLRIEIALRRNEIKPPSAEKIKLGKYYFDFRNQQLESPTHNIQLTSRETDLLLFLVKNQGNLCYRKEILMQLWGNVDFFNRKSMDVYLSKLRKYLEEDASIQIKNVHGKGFIFSIS